MTDQTPDEKFDTARFLVSKCWPYLATACFRLRLRWSRGLPTIGVTKSWRVYANPDWVDKTPVTELALILAGHELAHVLHGHHKRFEGADHHKANCAEDIAINDDLQGYCDAAAASQKASGTSVVAVFSPPTYGLYSRNTRDKHGNRLPAGLLPEDYYALLPDGLDLDNPCGSGATGVVEPWEEDDDDEEDVSASEAEVLVRATAQAVVDRACKCPGGVPAGLVRECQRVLTPARVPWRQVLRKAVRAFYQRVPGDWDHTYARPNRRAGGSIVLPSRTSFLPSVAAVLDTSGSMGPEELRLGLSEIAGVVSALGVPLSVVCTDAEAYDPVVVRSRSDVARMEIRGGGGTDGGAGIAVAAALRPTPSVIAVLTDGVTDWPDAPPPRSRVLVVLTSDPGPGYPVPKWADRVLLDGYGV